MTHLFGRRFIILNLLSLLFVVLATRNLNAGTEADNFQRANGPIGSNWAGTGTGNVSILNNTLDCSTSPSSQLSIYWNANSNGAAQYSQVTVGATVSTTTFGPAVRVLSGGSRYRFLWYSGSYYLQYMPGTGNGANLQIVSASTPSVGTVLTLSVSGTTLNAYVNGVLTLTASDSNLSSGQPGIDVGTGMPVGNAASGWSGGDLALLTEADNFQRANGPIGSNWAGTGTGNVSILNNTLDCSTSPSSQLSIYWNANSNSAAQYSQVTVGATVSTTTFGPAVRVLSGGSRYRFLWYSGSYYLQYMPGTGNGTTLQSVSASAPSVGTVLTLAVSGTTLNAYVNGALTLTASDSNLSSGQPGIDVGTGMPVGNAASGWSGGDLGAPPSITSLSPTSGPVGTSVTITGTNFGSAQGTSTVTFNGTLATPTSWSAAQIVAPVPSGATTGNVVVTVNGVASNGMSFTVVPTPSITSLSPTSAAVGTSVTITGTNFGSTEGTSTVTFNGVAATVSTNPPWSTTSIVATVPSGATTGNVVVTVGGVASNGMSFTVTTAPNITSLSPPSGTVGTSVTITGTNFGSTQGTSTVTFNGVAATVSPSPPWSTTSIVATVPSGATTGNVVVTVNGVTSNGVSFTVGPSNLLSLSYSYDQGGGKNNGDVVQITNNYDSTRTISYIYDQLDRVQTAGTSIWAESLGYDAWGNLLSITPTLGSAQNLSVQVNNKNQITTAGYTYDAAGNLTWDGVNSLRFDAENRATPTTDTYVYDGDSRRVQKSSGTTYWKGNNRTPLTVTDNAGNLQKDYIYFDGQVVGFYSYSASAPYFYLSDNLGSTRVVTSDDGKVIEWQADYDPFGGRLMVGTDQVSNQFTFTGYEYDSGTGYYNADFRLQSPTIGRFMSPDPISGSVTNPQSWNRYAYVMNRPTVLTDPQGLEGGGGCGIFCGPIIFGGGGGSGGSGRPPLHGPQPGQSAGGQSSGPLAGETLGIPNGIPLPPGTLAGILLPGDTGCEFGPCVPMGQGFQAQDSAPSDDSAPVGDLGALNYQAYLGMRLLKRINPFPRLERLAVWYLCGNSPEEGIENWMETGAVKGAISGAVAGAAGTLEFEGIGAVPGAIIGGFVVGTTAAGAGVLYGGAAAAICSSAGAYRGGR